MEPSDKEPEKKVFENNNANPKNASDNSSPYKKMQGKEIFPPKQVIMHIPLRKKMCWSNLHPRGSLYMAHVDIENVIDDLQKVRAQLEENKIKVKVIFDVLTKEHNHKALKSAASNFLQYQLCEDVVLSEIEKSEFLKKENLYKQEQLEKFSSEELLEILINQPVCYLRPDPINNHIIMESIKMSPLGNLVFTRDQQIVTKKGVILGHLNSHQRKNERAIIELFMKLINQEIVGELPKDGPELLEGGDFFLLKNEISLLGIGLRTNIESANYLLREDLFATDEVGLVIDQFDKDQDRMHLDTIFNILNEQEVILLDFDTVPSEHNIKRTIRMFKKITDPKNVDETKQRFGNYQFSYEKDFEEFLIQEGFKIIKVHHKQQLDYIINFLNIGNNKIVSSFNGMDQIMREKGSTVQVIEVAYNEVQKMYGALHCTTQALRPTPYVSPFNVPAKKEKNMETEFWIDEIFNEN